MEQDISSKIPINKFNLYKTVLDTLPRISTFFPLDSLLQCCGFFKTLLSRFKVFYFAYLFIHFRNTRIRRNRRTDETMNCYRSCCCYRPDRIDTRFTFDEKFQITFWGEGKCKCKMQTTTREDHRRSFFLAAFKLNISIFRYVLLILVFTLISFRSVIIMHLCMNHVQVLQVGKRMPITITYSFIATSRLIPWIIGL